MACASCLSELAAREIREAASAMKKRQTCFLTGRSVSISHCWLFDRAFAPSFLQLHPRIVEAVENIRLSLSGRGERICALLPLDDVMQVGDVIPSPGTGWFGRLTEFEGSNMDETPVDSVISSRFDSAQREEHIVRNLTGASASVICSCFSLC
jgi:hypothetical protein